MVSFKSILFAAVAGVALSSGVQAHNGVVHGRERRPRGERPADGARVRAMPPRVRGDRGERDPRPEDPARVRDDGGYGEEDMGYGYGEEERVRDPRGPRDPRPEDDDRVRVDDRDPRGERDPRPEDPPRDRGARGERDPRPLDGPRTRRPRE